LHFYLKSKTMRLLEIFTEKKQKKPRIKIRFTCLSYLILG